MKTVLITGASGFVGRHLVDAIRERHPEARLCLLDHPSSGICGSGRVLEQDGNDLRVAVDLACRDDLPSALEALTARLGPPDTVFHLAAQTEVGRSFQAPSETYETNVVGTARLLEAVSDISLRARVLIPGSAQIYQAPHQAPPPSGSGPGTSAAGATTHDPRLLDESAPIRPSSHYGVSKLAQEEVGRLFFESVGLPVYIARGFNHIGPGQPSGFVVPDLARQLVAAERGVGPAQVRDTRTKAAAPAAAKPPASALPARAIAAPEDPAEAQALSAELGTATAPTAPAPSAPSAAAPPPAVIRVGNLDARRDYLDVRDVVDAYLTIVERGEPGIPYNVASGRTWSVRELLDEMLAAAEVEVEVQVDPKLLRPAEISVAAGDASRLRALGWRPRHDINETLRETLDYWRRVLGYRVNRPTTR